MVSFPGTGVDPLVPQNLIFISLSLKGEGLQLFKISFEIEGFLL